MRYNEALNWAFVRVFNMYVYGSSDRLFINAALGCRARCSYCYLPSLDYELNATDLTVLKSDDLIVRVESHPDFKSGRNGTVLSLGCYSECWDESTREVTIELIEYFLQKGNPVQFATKRYVSVCDLQRVVPYIAWKGQLCIFISSSTLSKWTTVERGTDAPEVRFRSFHVASELGIPTYLYIKPVIKSITINDLEDYLCVLKDYPVTGVVVGQKFIEKNESSRGLLAPISDGELIYSNSDNGEGELFNRFSEYIGTYKESLHAVKYWREYA